MTWQQLLLYALQAQHKGVDGVISCSQLNIIEKCPYGAMQKQTRSEGVDSPSTIGTAIHRAMELEIWEPEGITEEAQFQINVMKCWLDELLADGWEIWHKEYYFERSYLTGSADVILKRGGELLIVDYKSGRTIISPNCLQMIGYAHLAFTEWVEYTGVSTAIFQPVVGSYEIIAHLPLEAEEKVWNALGEVMNPEKKICSFCSYCPHVGDCSETLNAMEMIHGLV